MSTEEEEERAFTLLRAMVKDAQDKIDAEDPMIEIEVGNEIIRARRGIIINGVRLGYENLVKEQSTQTPK